MQYLLSIMVVIFTWHTINFFGSRDNERVKK